MQTVFKRYNPLKYYEKYLLQNVSYSTTSANTCAILEKTATAPKTSFEDVVKQRQSQAKRSIVVQVNSEKSFPELYKYCSTYGCIVGAQHYCIRHKDAQHYILLEYETKEEADAALNSATYNEDTSVMKAKSPFLWFRAPNITKKDLKQSRDRFNQTNQTNTTNDNTNPNSISLVQLLNTVDGNAIKDQNELNILMYKAANIEEQILLLYQYTKLNDLGVRLRFLASLQIEKAIRGIVPHVSALPFGSSVNGFGRMGCDLDLILRLDQEIKGPRPFSPAFSSRLVYHTKENLTNERSQIQRQMECIGDILKLFLPGFCHERRILQARVPIIKYHHEHVNLEIDLSMSNLSGYYMSELLYVFGELDERVRPLTFCIRRWAQACGLTNPSPGRWITNFSLTCLVVFFLQQLKQPILPSINALVKWATTKDIRFTEDNINCTFARDFQNIAFRSKNSHKLNELLLQFFEYYSQFDYHNKAISLNEGRLIAKPDHSSLYIVNPLELFLNVSKNVSPEECERLRIEVRNAAWLLESEMEQQQQKCSNSHKENNNSNSNNNHQKEETASTIVPWGLLNLFVKANVVRPHSFFKPRILEVSDLFDKS